MAAPKELQQKMQTFLSEPTSFGGEDMKIVDLFDKIVAIAVAQIIGAAKQDSSLELLPMLKKIVGLQKVKMAAIRVAGSSTEAEKIFGPASKADLQSIRDVPAVIDYAMRSTSDQSAAEDFRAMKAAYSRIFKRGPDLPET